MKFSITILICFSFSVSTLFGQCEKVIISDSLFKIASQKGFSLLDWNGLRPANPHSGNGEIFTADQYF